MLEKRSEEVFIPENIEKEVDAKVAAEIGEDG